VNLLFLPLYPFILAVSFLTGFVPPRLGYAGAWLVGSLAYYLMPGRRRTMAENYAPVLGKPVNDPAVRHVGELSYRNFVRYVFEFLRLPHETVEAIDERVGLHTDRDFEEALASGKGLVFVSAHFGNMDYAATALCKRHLPLTVVADALKPRQLMDHLVEFRGKKGVKVVYGAKAPRAVIEALKNNEAVGFLLDVGCDRKEGVPVTFFGHRTMFPSGPALLALRTGAPIVVGYSLVVGDRIEAYSYPPIYYTPTGDKFEDARACSQLIANYFEDFLRRYPEQWYIFRPMWNTVPMRGATNRDKSQSTETVAERV
jgi:lauroyl/myristoyl acyltransferase